MLSKEACSASCGGISNNQDVELEDKLFPTLQNISGSLSTLWPGPGSSGASAPPHPCPCQSRGWDVQRENLSCGARSQGITFYAILCWHLPQPLERFSSPFLEGCVRIARLAPTSQGCQAVHRTSLFLGVCWAPMLCHRQFFMGVLGAQSLLCDVRNAYHEYAVPHAVRG